MKPPNLPSSELVKNMVRLVEEKAVDERIHLKFKGLVSICPFTKGEDRTDLGLSYIPGRSFDRSPVRVDAKKLEADLASLERKEIPMEVIPIEVLKLCIEHCVDRKLGRHAAPEEVEINSISGPATLGKGKGWGMKVDLRFDREVSSLIKS